MTARALDVTVETVIDRPIGVVATYAGEPSNAPSWYANIRRVEWETTPPPQVGSKARFEARFLGRTLRYIYEIVDLVPGERLTMRTAQGPFPMETTYTWSARSESSTRMTLRNRGTPAGFSRLFAPFMAGAVRRATTKDLRALKQLLEADRQA